MNKLDKAFDKTVKAMKDRDYDAVYKQFKQIEALEKDHIAEIGKLTEENNKLKLLLFAFVRNSGVVAIGHALQKTEEEITDKTFETIKEAEKIIDFEKMREFMNLASVKENRYDR